MSSDYSYPPEGSDVEPTARLETPAPGAVEEPRAEHGSESGWTTPADTGGRNALSVAHLVTGLVFLGVAGLWLAQETGAVEVEDLDLLGPLLLVVVGAAGLLAGLVRAARRR